MQPQRGERVVLTHTLQSWEKWKEGFQSRRDNRVLTHTLQRKNSDRDFVLQGHGFSRAAHSQ